MEPSRGYPSTPQHIGFGIIAWDRLETRRRADGGTVKFVPVICGVCNGERHVQAYGTFLGQASGRLTGRCRTCAPLLKRERIVAKYVARGIETLPNGCKIDWTTFTTPPPGVSSQPYRVEVICRCGYRRAKSLAAASYKVNTQLCRRCSSSDAHSGPKNGRWKGYQASGGYRMLVIPPNHPLIGMAEITGRSGWGKLFEHRLVAAETLGRPLEAWEHVHHINGKKSDNRPENLLVLRPEEHIIFTHMERIIKRLRHQNAALKQQVARLQNANAELLPFAG